MSDKVFDEVFEAAGAKVIEEHKDTFQRLANSDRTTSAFGALRDNRGKPEMHLLPYDALAGIATVLGDAYQSGRYPKYNWQLGFNHSSIMDSLLRHALKLSSGEVVDPDSKRPHSWHIGANIVMLIWHEIHKPELQDWPKLENKPQENL